MLVVLRYDRVNDGARLRRIHQEDLCQALRRPPTEKYQSDGGPTPAEIAEVIRSESVTGAADIARFADALIYNWAIAAGDAHAKNYSLLLEDDGVALAPLYDVMSHLPYRGRKQANNLKTAMKIGDDYRLRRTSRAKAWRLAASQIGLDPDSVADRVEDLVRRTPDAIDAAIDALDPADRAWPRAAALSRDMQQRRRDVLAVFVQPRSAPPTGAAGTTGPARRGLSYAPARPAPVAAVVCGQRLGPGRRCQRKLTRKPCPLHPHSAGSISITNRR